MQVFTEGLVHAATTVKSVVITGGTNAGVMKVTGSALAQHRDVPLIGIATLQRVFGFEEIGKERANPGADALARGGMLVEYNIYDPELTDTAATPVSTAEVKAGGDMTSPVSPTSPRNNIKDVHEFRERGQLRINVPIHTTNALNRNHSVRACVFELVLAVQRRGLRSPHIPSRAAQFFILVVGDDRYPNGDIKWGCETKFRDRCVRAVRAVCVCTRWCVVVCAWTCRGSLPVLPCPCSVERELLRSPSVFSPIAGFQSPVLALLSCQVDCAHACVPVVRS